MDIKKCPTSVFLTMVVLFLTVYVGSVSVSYTFGEWAAFRSMPFPIRNVLYAVGVCLLPTLAMMDILRSQMSGRYLGLLTMMILWGFGLRAFTHVAIARVEMIIPMLSILIGLVLLIYSFGFGKKANDFFGKGI